MIIVTGASKGIGKAICERLYANDKAILGIARNKHDFTLPFVCADVASYESIKKVTKTLRGEKIEAVINTAGIASMNLAISTPPEITNNIIQTNLLGTIYCCQLFAPSMIRNKGGSFINFSTIAVPLGLKGESIYVASKAGVESFTRVFAKEVAEFNINVNCISPGPIATDLLKGVSGQQIDCIIGQQIIKKQYSTDTVCDLVEILLDKRSASISGQILHVGGI